MNVRQVLRTAAAVVVMVGLGVALGSGVLYVTGIRDDLNEERQARRLLTEQVWSLDAKPVVGPSGDPGDQGERGEPGPRGLPGEDATDDQVYASVVRWLNLNPPVDQPDPDDPEVQDPEIQDAEAQDPEQQDDEIQDDEIDDPDPDDPEIQDPEVDDPDPDGNPCPAGYSMQPLTPNDDSRLICTKDPAPVPVP